MSYNIEVFPDTYEALNARLDTFASVQKVALKLLIDFMENIDRVEQKSSRHVAFAELTAKLRVNLESIHDLLPKLYDDYRFKTSVNILYRGLLSDLINTLYLLSWCKTGEEQPLLSAELDILHIDFLEAMFRISESESVLAPSQKQANEEWQTQVLEQNSTLYNPVRKKWKLPPEVRERTGETYPKYLKSSSENGRMMRIGEMKLQDRHLLDSCFRYLAQFQHFSPITHELLMKDIAYDLQVYEGILHTILRTIECIFRVLEYKNKEGMNIQYNFLIQRYKQVYPPPASPPREEPPS